MTTTARTYNSRKLYPSIYLFLVFLFGLTAQAQQGDKPREIFIEAVTGLQYDVVRFAVRPGEKIKITLTNQDDMGHNLLITKPGTRLDVVNAALQLAEKGPRMDYIPESSDVLWSIPVIYLGESRSLEFNAPKAPGTYPYVCTYPGHGFLMYGVMYVTEEGEMPDLLEDENVPPSRREAVRGKDAIGEHHAHQEEAPPALHPYDPAPPYLYRVFIENSGLASIAVNLPQNISYCWDATACQLRFAWTGDFLDNADLWHGHKNAYAHVLGDIFYRDKTAFPLRIGNTETIPEAKYKGYRMVDRYPEFHYQLAGWPVYEIIHPKADGSGLVRQFRMPEMEEPVWFVFDAEDGVEYQASAGEWENGRLKLSPVQARDFTIIMTKIDGGLK